MRPQSIIKTEKRPKTIATSLIHNFLHQSAGELLIKTYTDLRQREGMGGGKSTWRVTVRQLESLLRLSEALAKLECLDEVTERHVKEARRLLSKSIVRVEQPDIDLEDGMAGATQDNGMEVDEAPPIMAALNEIPSDVPNGDARACLEISFLVIRVGSVGCKVNWECCCCSYQRARA